MYGPKFRIISNGVYAEVKVAIHQSFEVGFGEKGAKLRHTPTRRVNDAWVS